MSKFLRQEEIDAFNVIVTNYYRDSAVNAVRGVFELIQKCDDRYEPLRSLTFIAGETQDQEAEAVRIDNVVTGEESSGIDFQEGSLIIGAYMLWVCSPHPESSKDKILESLLTLYSTTDGSMDWKSINSRWAGINFQFNVALHQMQNN